MRLIDADKLIKALSKYAGFTEKIYLNEFIKEIDNAPTVSYIISPDYVTELQNRNNELIKQLEEIERPQGEWKVEDKIYCSKCGESICDFVPNPTDAVVLISENKFCFNCGADMRKGDAE